MNRNGIVATGLIVGFLAVWEAAVRVTGTPVYLVRPVRHRHGAGRGRVDLLRRRHHLPGDGRAGRGRGTGSLDGDGDHVLAAVRAGRDVAGPPHQVDAIIAVAPILTVWLSGPAPVVVTALLTFFPVLINSLEGFRSVDPAVADWFRSVDAPPRQYFLQARWPSARPFLFAALKVAAPLSLIGAVVAEWMGASSGLGRRMWLAYTNLDMPSLFAAVAVLTALSAGIYRLVVSAEKKTVHWT